MLEGNGAKIRDTLEALSAALKVGVDNKDAISNIVLRLNELTTILAENDQTIRDLSNRMTRCPACSPSIPPVCRRPSTS